MPAFFQEQSQIAGNSFPGLRTICVGIPPRVPPILRDVRILVTISERGQRVVKDNSRALRARHAKRWRYQGKAGVSLATLWEGTWIQHAKDNNNAF